MSLRVMHRRCHRCGCRPSHQLSAPGAEPQTLARSHYTALRCESLPDRWYRPCGECRSVPYSRSEEHTSELQSLMRISYAVFCLKKKTKHNQPQLITTSQY